MKASKFTDAQKARRLLRSAAKRGSVRRRISMGEAHWDFADRYEAANGLMSADSATEYTTDSVVSTFRAARHEKAACVRESILLAIYASMIYVV